MAMNAPLWREISKNLERRIEMKQLRPGDRLPTEYELSHEFMVNRHTVRRALSYLQEKGMVESTQGRGSFVRRPSSPMKLHRRPRFSDAVRSGGREPSTRTLKLDVRPAEAKVAQDLGLKTGAPVVHLARLRLVDDEPIGLSTHCFSFERFPTFIEMYRARGGITQTLIDSGVPDYTRKRTTISARLPTAREADLLHLPRHVSLLIRRYLNVDGLGRPLEWGESSGTSEVVIDFPAITND
jgi:GntR family transcriptional regulator, phosphonate transport system regulatory protein